MVFNNRVDVRGRKYVLARLRLILARAAGSLVSDELIKPTRRLILLQMFAKQARQNTTGKYF